MTRLVPEHPILITTDPIGGVWTYTLELARELGRRGIGVGLASMGRRLTAAERAQVRKLAHVELFESDFKLEWMKDPWNDVAAAGDWLSDLAGQISPTVIHLNQFSHGALHWHARCLVVGHSCVYSWFAAVRHHPPGDHWRHYKHQVSLGLRGADLVTAPSRWMLSQLEKNYGQFAAAAPIYNGRQQQSPVPPSKQEFILTSGRLWDEAKNVGILQRVAAKLPWPILAAGETLTPDGNCVELTNLRLLGVLEEPALNDWMARAAIFVLPARYEPFGLTVLEAALAGCALVLGDIPSLREIWQDAALFVAPDDAAELIAALAALIADPQLRRDRGRQAQIRAATFTPERMTDGYMALYRKLASDAAAPRAAVDPSLHMEG